MVLCNTIFMLHNFQFNSSIFMQKKKYCLLTRIWRKQDEFYSRHITLFSFFSKRSIFLLWLWFPPSIPFVGKLRQKSFCQCRGKYLWGTEQIQLFFIWKYTRQLPKQFTFLSIFIFSIGSGHVRVRGDPMIHSIRKFKRFFA